MKSDEETDGLGLQFAFEVCLKSASGRVIAIEGFSPLDPWFVSSGGVPSFMVMLPNELDIEIDETRGYTSNILKSEPTKKLLISPNNKYPLGAFLSMLEFLKLETERFDSHLEAAKALPMLLARHSQFSQRRGISERELRGLMGELFVLKQILLANDSTVQSLESWIGPFGGADFRVRGGRSLEVKTIYPDARSIKVSSEFQLMAKQPEMVLSVLTLEESHGDEGSSLQELHQDIMSQISHDQRAISIFESAFGAAIDEQMMESKLSKRRLRVTKQESFTVGKDAPILSVTQLPEGVSNVSYRIDISALKNAETDLERFLVLND